MKQVGGGSYCTDLITNYNNNHTKWSKEVQEIALDMMQARRSPPRMRSDSCRQTEAARRNNPSNRRDSARAARRIPGG